MGIKKTLPGDITPYKVGGLVFQSKYRYQDLKGIDSGAKVIVSDYNEEKYFQDFLNKSSMIKVIETYPEAREEIEGLFPNLTGFLCYEHFGTNSYRERCYKFAKKFFSKFEYIEI